MADRPIVHIGELARAGGLQALQAIAYVEGKKIAAGGEMPKAERKWILDTYAECLETIRHPNMRAIADSKPRN